MWASVTSPSDRPFERRRGRQKARRRWPEIAGVLAAVTRSGDGPPRPGRAHQSSCAGALAIAEADGQAERWAGVVVTDSGGRGRHAAQVRGRLDVADGPQRDCPPALANSEAAPEPEPRRAAHRPSPGHRRAEPRPQPQPRPGAAAGARAPEGVGDDASSCWQSSVRSREDGADAARPEPGPSPSLSTEDRFSAHPLAQRGRATAGAPPQLEQLDQEQQSSRRQAASEFPSAFGGLEDVPRPTAAAMPRTARGRLRGRRGHTARRTAKGRLLVTKQGGEAARQAERQPQDAALLAGAVDASGAGPVGTAYGGELQQLQEATARLNRLNDSTETAPSAWQDQVVGAVADAHEEHETQRRFRVAQQIAHAAVSLHGSEAQLSGPATAAAAAQVSRCGDLEDCDLIPHAGAEVLQGVMRGVFLPSAYHHLFAQQTVQQPASEERGGWRNATGADC